MKPNLLPPTNLWLSLPALSADEAEMILHFVDELQRLLWEAYGEAVFDNCAENHGSDPRPPHDRDGGPDF